MNASPAGATTRNMDIKKILFTCAGGGSPLYFAREMRRSHGIFLADGRDQNAGPHMGFPFEKIPFGSDPAFPSAIRDLIRRWEIDCVVPGSDGELPAFIELSKETSSPLLMMPSAEFTRLCLDKSKLMRRLAADGISHLAPFDDAAQVRYPAVMKPVSGEGSRQVHVVSNNEELEGYLKLYGKAFDTVLTQPFINGTEYTVSVVVNNLNRLIGVVPKRIIEKKGITRAAVSERHPAIERVCADIVERFRPCGIFNVQLMVCEGEVYIFEINPRLSTTSVLTHRCFGNEIELCAKHYDADTVIDPPVLKEGVFLYRYEENVFVP